MASIRTSPMTSIRRASKCPSSSAADADTMQSSQQCRMGMVTAATIAGTPVIENYATDHHANQYALGWNTLVGQSRWLASNGAISAGHARTAPSTTSRRRQASAYGHNSTGPTAIVSYTDDGPRTRIRQQLQWHNSGARPDRRRRMEQFSGSGRLRQAAQEQGRSQGTSRRDRTGDRQLREVDQGRRRLYRPW